MVGLLLGGLLGVASAADGVDLYWQEMVAVAVNPGGVLSDTVVEARGPVLRFGDPISNMTYLGAGGRASVSPAHSEVAARVSFMPIDLLPLKVELARVQYWKSPFGLIGMSSAENTDYAARKPRYDDGQSFAAGGWTLNLNPGGQFQVGPVVGFTSLMWSFIRIEPEVDVAERWVFEPYRGLVIGFEDRVFEHTSAMLWQAMDGDDRALLRVGPVMRGKSALVTPDQVLTVGGLVQTRPGTAPAMPTFMLVSTVYLIDPDYVGGPPWFAATATWESR